MKRKNLSKFVALAMAGAMMIVPIPASAAEVDSEDAAQGTTTGTGDVEGIVNKDVFKVELPTVATGDTTFNFILDPQGLITDTNGSAYTDATFAPDAKGLYFANPVTGGTTVEYKASSPALSAKNKGTTNVDVTLTAAAKDLSTADYSIALSDSDTFVDKSTSVYLALVSGSQTATLTKDGATITDTLDAAPADAYEVTYNSTESKYEYGLTAAAQAADYTGFDSLDFNLVGACNTNADWAAAKDATPGVDVAWQLERPKAAPSAPSAAVFVKGDDTVVSGISLGTGRLAATKATINMSRSNDKNGEYLTTALPLNGDSVTIPGTTWGGAPIGDYRFLRVQFNDTAKTTKYIQIEISNSKAPSAPTTATFVKGTDLVVSGISLGAGAAGAANVTATLSRTNSNTGEYLTPPLDYSDGSVTIPGSTWGGASIGDKRYLKLEFDTVPATILYVEVTISA